MIHERLSSLMRNPSFWLIVAMVAFCVFLHYSPHIAILRAISPEVQLRLTRHVMDRILFLLPVTYAAFIFGTRGGLITLVVAVAAMIPRIVLFSPVPLDASLETASVVLVGGLVVLFFQSQQAERKRRMDNERRLAALNTISVTLSQSFELESILKSALERVLETMNLEAEGGIFLMDEETRELVLSVHHGLSTEFIRQEERIALGECLRGLVAQSGELLFSEDCYNDVGHTRQSKASAHSHLIVPLKSKGRVVGVMFLYPHALYHPSAQDLQLLVAIGNQIGVAIENARLYEQERLVAEQLRVSEKTYRDMFENANEAIWVHDLKGKITAANQASAKLMGCEREVLIGRMARDFLSEQNLGIARELHDDTAQGLIALSRQLEKLMLAKERLSEEDIKLLGGLQQQTNAILEGVRRFGQDLRPSILDDLGLLPALESLADDLTKHGVDTKVKIVGEARRLPAEVELALFRIVQEALRNVWRHSQASRTELTIEFSDTKLVILISDNGKGFELPQRLGDLASTGKLGLAGMQERARLIGGTLTLQSEPGAGTTVTVAVPV